QPSFLASPTPVELPAPALDPTATWETYLNLEQGLLIKYPPGTTFKEADLRAPFFVEMTRKDFGLSIKTKKAEASVYYLDQESSEELQLGGETASFYKFPDGYCDMGQCTQPFVAVVVSKDDWQYSLEFQGKELGQTAKLMLATFKFLTTEEKGISFRIDEEGDLTKVILIDKAGEERVLREYHWPDTGRARRLYPSPNNQFLAISQGTAHLGLLEIINLGNEETIASLSEYGKVIWLDGSKLVLNTPETVDPPRPYEGGEGVNLAAFDAASNQSRVLKRADEATDYPLLRVEDGEIFFEKRVVKEEGDWTQPTITQWKINFEGTVEIEIK
ncbi:MAG TPA: hypothetical protein VMX77_02490, partial [Candidatus Bathyarchaeia archaeon]|nr:hypothetical protein [Candidatus Bathyarchaeia archaeon]